MSYTPFQAPVLSGLFGDIEVASCFSVNSEMEAMLRYEAELARAEAAHGVIPVEAADAIASACEDFEPDLKAIAAATAIDGVPVPELVRQLRARVGEPNARYCHFAATSQDVVDTALILRLRMVIATLDNRLEDICDRLDRLSQRFGDNPLTGRTRMQAALPIKVRDRIAIWRDPVMHHRKKLGDLSPQLLCLQFGGPVGTLEKMGDRAYPVAAALANALGLAVPARSWHSERASIVEFGDWLALVSGSLGKAGMDIALMAQDEISEIRLAGAGSSSAMPHKRNPVLAESLATLARFTATLAGGMHHAMLHEQERSGVAWSLEWLLLPQLCVAVGAATRNAIALFESVEEIGRTP